MSHFENGLYGTEFALCKRSTCIISRCIIMERIIMSDSKYNVLIWDTLTRIEGVDRKGNPFETKSGFKNRKERRKALKKGHTVKAITMGRVKIKCGEIYWHKKKKINIYVEDITLQTSFGREMDSVTYSYLEMKDNTLYKTYRDSSHAAHLVKVLAPASSLKALFGDKLVVRPQYIDWHDIWTNGK